MGARKDKSVRNHIFVVNSIVSYVLFSVRKSPIDLTVMDFKQMFDSEEVQICLNALYEAGIEDDTFALIYKANHVNHVAVKMAQGLTERRQIFDNIMQRDVLGPLVSSNMVDKHIGRSIMSDFTVKKYLCNIIESDGRNKYSIKDKTNKAQGNINKIITTLTERPYGQHNFKASKLMRESILLGGLLTNSEAWINILNEDLDNLEKPDTILMRKILSNTGNPSKVFMLLEMGVIPVTLVLMQKRMNFLHYILKESTTTMIRQVFNALKENSRKGDFLALSNNEAVCIRVSAPQALSKRYILKKLNVFIYWYCQLTVFYSGFSFLLLFGAIRSVCARRAG